MQCSIVHELKLTNFNWWIAADWLQYRTDAHLVQHDAHHCPGQGHYAEEKLEELNLKLYLNKSNQIKFIWIWYNNLC